MEDLAKFFANPSLLAADEAAAKRANAVSSLGRDEYEHDDAFMSKIAQSIIDDDDYDEDAGRNAVKRNGSSFSLLGAKRSSKSALGFNDIFAEDGELKADAPLFVPGKAVRSHESSRSCSFVGYVYAMVLHVLCVNGGLA